MVEYKSTKASIHRPGESVVWPGDASLVITLTDPCSTETYQPVDFSETTSFKIDYTICQATESVLSFDFTDALSKLSTQADFCGQPTFEFFFSDPAL